MVESWNNNNNAYWNNNNAHYGYTGGYGYAPACCPPVTYGTNPFVLIVVLFILLIIVGATFVR